MALNEIARGDIFDVTLTAAATSSQPILMGDLLGVAVTNGAVGEVIAVACEGVFEIAKRTTAGAAIAQGAKVYWDATNSRIDNTDNTGANKLAGYAYMPAASGDATVQVRLLG